jgi:hypothetical protein
MRYAATWTLHFPLDFLFDFSQFFPRIRSRFFPRKAAKDGFSARSLFHADAVGRRGMVFARALLLRLCAGEGIYLQSRDQGSEIRKGPQVEGRAIPSENPEVGHGGFKVEVQQCIIQMSQ